MTVPADVEAMCKRLEGPVMEDFGLSGLGQEAAAMLRSLDAECSALHETNYANEGKLRALSKERDEWQSAYNVRNDEVTGLSGQLDEARSLSKDAERWRIFRNRDACEDLSFDDFEEQYREDADAIADAALAAKGADVIDTASLPWRIAKFDVLASTNPDADRGYCILSADGETIIAQRVMREHAEMILTAVHAYYGKQ